MSFYVTLPSSSIKDGAGAEYRTTLQRELILPEDDWHVALANFQYIGQKWGSLTVRERTIGVQYYGPITKKWVMDWSTMGEFKVYVNSSSKEIVKANYTWEELQQQVKLAFESSLAEQNISRRKQKMVEYKAGVLFISKDTLGITKNEESEFEVIFSPPLAVLLGISSKSSTPGVIKCPKGMALVKISYVEPYVIESSSQVIHFKPVDSIDYSVSVTIGDGAMAKKTKVTIPQCYWSHKMLCQYITSKLGEKSVNCVFLVKEYKENRVGDNVEITGVIKCVLRVDDSSQIELSSEFQKVCGIHSHNVIQPGNPYECEYLFKTNLQVTGYEPKIFQLDKSSFGNIETICNVITKTITKEVGRKKETVFNFELKYPQVIINAPQLTKYRLRLERSFLRKLGFLTESHGESYPTNMGPPVGKPFNDTFVWLLFPEDKKRGLSLNYVGDNAPEHLLEGRNMPAFWVYSNIISEQFVGESCIPLLRVVPNNAAENAPHMESLDGQYLPLCTRRINSIKIKICVGPSDELVQFDNEVTCVLHFMRRS